MAAEQIFEFNVNIQASNNEDARKLLKGALDLMKAAKTQMTVDEFLKFSEKIKEKPNLINAAKKFVL
jgi:hypothetical protein